MKTRMLMLLCGAWALAAVAAAGASWADSGDGAAFMESLQTFFEGTESRAVGSPGNLLMEQRVFDRFAASGHRHGAIHFTTPAFQPGATRLLLDAGSEVTVHPMHPTLFRPGNFQQASFTAPLVYLGRGNSDDIEHLRGRSLEGALAVMEFDSAERWLEFLRFGVTGFLFLPPEQGALNRHDALTKVYASEVNVPRFWVPFDAAQKVRSAARAAAEASVAAEPSRWEPRALRSPWVFIPGTDPELGREVLVLTAALDANSIVPGLAPGAQSGANLYLLMELFERLKAQPPSRSVMLVAVNARTQNGLGERLLAWYLLAERASVESVRDRIAADLSEQRLMADYYGRLQLDTFRQEDEDFLIEMRTLLDDTTGRILTIKDPIVARSRGDVNRIKNERLLLNQRQAEERTRMPEEEYKAALRELNAKQDSYVNILTLFNRVGVRTALSDLTPDEVEVLRDYVLEIRHFFRTSAELNAADLDRDMGNSAIRHAVDGRRVPAVILLELDWSTGEIGFSTGHRGESLIGQAVIRWGGNTRNIAERMSEVAEAGRPNLLVDTLSRRGGRTENYYFYRHVSARNLFSPVTFFPLAGRTPAFGLRNVFSHFGRAFLPTDTFDRLDAQPTAEVFEFSVAFLQALIEDPEVLSTRELGPAVTRERPMYTRRFGTFKFDDLAASVQPDIPVPGSVVIVRQDTPMAPTERLPLAYESIGQGDIVQADLMLTDERAVVYNYAQVAWGVEDIYNAMQYDADYTRMLHALDGGDALRKIAPQDRFMDALLPMFESQEIVLYHTNDPSLTGDTNIDISTLLPLTARGNATPRRFGITGVPTPMSQLALRRTAGVPAALYLPYDEPVKIVTAEKRTLLNATQEEPEGLGFLSQQDLGHDILGQMIRDMSLLNHARITQLADVATDLAREFKERGDKAMERRQQALDRGDYRATRHYEYEALGAHTKSYDQTKQTTDDMLKAVVVYMALLLPFCFFVQKLLFKFTKIEKELAAFAVLFVATFIVFRTIHPAFRVAQAAEAIFIAFVMGSLGLFVISILRGRFEGEMQLLFRTFTGMDTDTAGYSMVTQKAMLVGVNNMKRRRIRTLLTTATIVLVAFTMLSFTSVTKRVRPTIITISRDAPYNGFMYHWPDLVPMDEASASVVRGLFAGAGDIAERRWLVPDDHPFRVSHGDAHMHVEAILGLSKHDRDLLGPFPLAGGSYFSSDDADEALIAASVASILGIEEGDLGHSEISMHGHTYRVVGLFDEIRFRGLRDLNGIPLAPVLRMVAEGDTSAETLDPSGLRDPGALLQADTSSVLLLPVEAARRLGAQPFSLSLRLPADRALWPLVDRFLTSTAMRFYISTQAAMSTAVVGEDEETEGRLGAGVYFVGSNYRTSIGGLAVLIIPLIIAATIILNTMLGAVYERKAEIAIYNAIGLNPHHIGLFFLAESFVYGVIGSVGGYLIGQVLSIVLARTGWVQDINLNYSSLSVAYVILFTIAMVLLSTLYPAVTATRAAVPSGKHKWSLPKHDGQTMQVIFPFIYQPHMALGVLGYLKDYLDRFTEASIGDLIASLEACGTSKDVQDRPVYTMNYIVALAPYDLGVTQKVHFRLYYDEEVQAYRLEMNNIRVSGQDTNWVTTNRPFLERMRKYLMRWRNLTASQQDAYRERGAELVDGADV